MLFRSSPDPRGVAICVPHRLPGALWWRGLLRDLCIRWETAVGWPRTDQRGEVRLHRWRRAGGGDGRHHSKLRCLRRPGQNVRGYHAGERRLGFRLGEDRGVRPGRRTGSQLRIQAGRGLLLDQTHLHWHLADSSSCVCEPVKSEKRWDKYNSLMFAQILKTNRKKKKKIAKKHGKKNKLYMMCPVNRGVIQFELAVCKCIIMHIDDSYIYLECSCV